MSPARCWNCRRRIDSATALDPEFSEVPQPGSVALCVHCGVIAVFDDTLRLARPGPAVLDQLENSRDFRAVFAAFAWQRVRSLAE